MAAKLASDSQFDVKSRLLPNNHRIEIDIPDPHESRSGDEECGLVAELPSAFGVGTSLRRMVQMVSSSHGAVPWCSKCKAKLVGSCTSNPSSLLPRLES